MDSLKLIGILSGVLSALCYIPYIKDIFLGKTKPERASWFIWATLGSIAFFSQLDKGAIHSLWLTGVQTVGVVIVFALSIKRGMGGFVRRDIISLLIAFLGLIVWYFTKDALYALLLVILVDGVGSYLTIIKSYKAPESETLITWILAGASGVLAMVAVGSINLILLSYPAYTALINIAVVIAIFLGRKKQ